MIAVMQRDLVWFYLQRIYLSLIFVYKMCTKIVRHTEHIFSMSVYSYMVYYNCDQGMSRYV